MPTSQIISLIFAVLTVFMAVILIMFIKAYGNIPKGSVGPELNLLTYGSLWDTVVDAIKGKIYWEFIDSVLVPYKGLVLLILVICNFLMMSANFKLAKKIELANKINKEVYGLKFVSILFGTLSLLIFFTLKVFWQ